MATLIHKQQTDTMHRTPCIGQLLIRFTGTFTLILQNPIHNDIFTSLYNFHIL